MPNCCSVPNCRGNYKTGPKVSVFNFPSDPELRAKWIRAIMREDFEPTKNSKVCEEHFAPHDIIREVEEYDERTGRLLSAPLKWPRLRPGAVPSLLPNCPSYLSSQTSIRESPGKRRKAKEFSALEKAVEESIREKETYDRERMVSSLGDLGEKLRFLDLGNFWTVVRKHDCILFLNIILNPIPLIQYSVVVNEALDVNVNLEKVQILKLGKFSFPMKIDNVGILGEILSKVSCSASSGRHSSDSVVIATDFLKSVMPDSDPCYQFIGEQLSLKCANKPDYSTDMWIFSAILHSLSPAAYKYIRQTGKCVLPHPSTIQRMSSALSLSPMCEQQGNNFLKYLQQKYPCLKPQDKNVILMLDEIHLKSFLDYRAGNIVGMAYDGDKLASSAHVFMISSVSSPYKDVAHVLPVRSMTYVELHHFIKKIIVRLEDIGFHVFAVVTDNNSINRKSMSQFSTPPDFQIVYPHPVNRTRPLFYIIDPVHLIKSIRNNWLNQKNDGKCMFFPSFPDFTQDKEFHSASFMSLKKLHNQESHCLAKFGYSLSLKALSPSSLERQNVKLVLQIFNDYLIAALLDVGNKYDIPNSESTAAYLKIMLTWWKIMNVKTLSAGLRLNDKFKCPLTTAPDDDKYLFLNQFLDWLDRWESMKCSTGVLTKETLSALKLSTYAILEILSYCVGELKMSFILPGKFQTDNLEGRFSLYRQMSGSNYHISVRQLYECENKLRVQENMRLGILSKKRGRITITEISFDGNYEGMEESIDGVSNFEVNVGDDDIVEVEKLLPVLAYIAGYCVFCAVRKLRCDACKEVLTVEKDLHFDSAFSYIIKLDRGQLLCPSPNVVNLILYNYLIIAKLCGSEEEEFLKVSSQRLLAVALTEKLVDCENLFLDTCPLGHTASDVSKMLLWSSTNIFLNNYCKKRNDSELEEKTKKVRGLQKFKK